MKNVKCPGCGAKHGELHAGEYRCNQCDAEFRVGNSSKSNPSPASIEGISSVPDAIDDLIGFIQSANWPEPFHLSTPYINEKAYKRTTLFPAPYAGSRHRRVLPDVSYVSLKALDEKIKNLCELRGVGKKYPVGTIVEVTELERYQKRFPYGSTLAGRTFYGRVGEVIGYQDKNQPRSYVVALDHMPKSFDPIQDAVIGAFPENKLTLAFPK